MRGEDGRCRRSSPILWGQPDDKPVSVPLRATVIPLGRPLLDGSSDLPESRAERVAPPLLFGLAPRGVYPAVRIAPDAVRSYRTFSPLPPANRVGGIFSVALSVKSALSGPPRPLAGTPPCGDRTFLPRFRERLPVRRALTPLSHLAPAVRGFGGKL